MRDLEQKVQDQEEELDEQAGQIQMLEQVRLQRLEELLLCMFDWIRYMLSTSELIVILHAAIQVL